jgi:hypothetical protein
VGRIQEVVDQGDGPINGHSNHGRIPFEVRRVSLRSPQPTA